MKLIFVLILGLTLGLSLRSQADESDDFTEGSLDLLNAVTLCPKPNNPLINGLQAMGGNRFASVGSTIKNHSPGFVTIRATLVSSPHAQNLSIMAPDRILGFIEVQTGYPQTSSRDRPLVCRLTIKRQK